MAAAFEPETNRVKAHDHIREAAARGAKIVCLQELFDTIYFPFEIDRRYFGWAEPIDGPTVTRFRDLAAALEIVLVVPFFERAQSGLYFNTAVVIGPAGESLGVYRKSHIPLITTPQLDGFEKYYFAPGNTGFQVFPTPFGIRVGILICYDRHFPEGARALALQGADVVFVPTATAGMSRDSWETELRAHALANLYFVGGVNRVGHDERGSGTAFFGSSVWIDPRGTTISHASENSDEVLMADLDLSEIYNGREKWGFFRDRRPELYEELGARFERPRMPD